MTASFITLLTDDPSTPVPWWHVKHDDIIAQGEFAPGDTAAPFPAMAPNMSVIALVPSANVHLNWVEMNDMPPRQAETAARIKIAESSLGAKDGNHHVAAEQGDGYILVATMNRDKLHAGLGLLARFGVNPDIILPAAMIISPPETGFHSADIGGAFLRGNKMALPDEPALRDIFVHDAPVTPVTPAQLDAALAAISQNIPINLRSGDFVKRDRTSPISPRQWRILALLTLSALLISLLLAIATLWTYSRAKSRENDRAVTAAKKIIPGATNIMSAQAGLNVELQKRGLDRRQFSVLAARLFILIKGQENVTLRDMQYSTDKIISANLSAPDMGQITVILSALQSGGYKVTATPRRDESGLMIVNINVGAL